MLNMSCNTNDIPATTLAEALPAEQSRVRQLLSDVKEIGPSGQLLAFMLTASLANAEKAAASGDVVAMIAAYKDLQGYKG